MSPSKHLKIKIKHSIRFSIDTSSVHDNREAKLLPRPTYASWDGTAWFGLVQSTAVWLLDSCQYIQRIVHNWNHLVEVERTVNNEVGLPHTGNGLEMAGSGNTGGGGRGGKVGEGSRRGLVWFTGVDKIARKTSEARTKKVQILITKIWNDSLAAREQFRFSVSKLPVQKSHLWRLPSFQACYDILGTCTKSSQKNDNNPKNQKRWI